MKRIIVGVLSTVLMLTLVVSITACGSELKLEGSVRNAVTNDLLSGVKVTLDDDTKAITNNKGLFAFQGISKGEHVVTYELAGFKKLNETYNVEGSWFEEIKLQPLGTYGDITDEFDENEESGNTKPIPPGDEVVGNLGLRTFSNFNNLRMILSSSAPSVSSQDTQILEVCDGVIRIKSHASQVTETQFEMIIDGNTFYDKDPQNGQWYKHSEPVFDENEGPPTLVTLVSRWFDAIEKVMRNKNAVFTNMDTVTTEGIKYTRFHLSGVGADDASISFKGELFVLDSVVMGFNGTVSTGAKEYEKMTQYIVVYDIGKVETIEIPQNVTSLDEMEFGAPGEPTPFPPEGMPEPPPMPDRETDR